MLYPGTRQPSAARDRITLDGCTDHVASGTEPAALKHELSQVRGIGTAALPEDVDPTVAIDGKAAVP
ncbi:ABC transporter ATP-binding protein [Streptomyces sp. NPDC093990]|uniref:ABC transporter ATP-binding protein n=1 Tax=Streptomyces sp. NPDC093990 TaxID=3155306 RepID=UPI0034411926